MFQNMVNKDNALDQPVQQKLDTLKKIMINEGIAIIGITEVNISWSKIRIKENIFNRTEVWFKTGKISTGYNWVTISYKCLKVDAHPSWWWMNYHAEQLQ